MIFNDQTSRKIIHHQNFCALPKSGDFKIEWWDSWHHTVKTILQELLSHARHIFVIIMKIVRRDISTVLMVNVLPQSQGVK